jgi:uncharacterized peroxidase-related enzyme
MRMASSTFYDLQPALPQALLNLGKAVAAGGLESSLIHLVKLRVSQINHCAYCQHMHAAEARKDGERQERLDVLVAWRETTCFSDRERAALNWSEVVTLLPNTTPEDSDYQILKQHFSDKEISDLMAVIVAINGWNRIAVSMGFTPDIQ